MKTKKIVNYIWTIFNLLLFIGEWTIIWAANSNEKRMNLGLWKLSQGEFAGFARVDGLYAGALKVLFVVVVLLAASFVLSKVTANLRIKRLSIDVWALWNLAATVFILLRVFVHVRGFLPYYEVERGIFEARTMLEKDHAVVHGAGWIEDESGNTYDYTNSLEALTNSYNMGNRVVEMDFLCTSDGKIVCAHESETFARGIDSDGPLTEEEFLARRSYGIFTTMNVDMLADFMYGHQDLYIVTDFKYDMPESCTYIAEYYPDLLDRFIVQIYHYDQYDYVKEFGFNNIILTLYLTYEDERNTDMLCDFVRNNNLVGLTFWEYYMDSADDWTRPEEFFDIVKKLDVPICVHTVNDAGAIKYDFEHGVTAVYTDNVDNGWMKD